MTSTGLRQRKSQFTQVQNFLNSDELVKLTDDLEKSRNSPEAKRRRKLWKKVRNYLETAFLTITSFAIFYWGGLWSNVTSADIVSKWLFLFVIAFLAFIINIVYYSYYIPYKTKKEFDTDAYFKENPYAWITPIVTGLLSMIFFILTLWKFYSYKSILIFIVLILTSLNWLPYLP
ncbi:transmembrane protein [Anaeramoeba flamelloides]|uniref:Transmembrane protein n=1 Tax=Anaeramoeba flamelloides TaxID=1746091 RepID=A0AAV7ZYR0_9EUKA|nr:transmembrane protein [Anaeramoeba flamelloides]